MINYLRNMIEGDDKKAIRSLELRPGCSGRRRRQIEAPTIKNLKGNILAYRVWQIGYDGQLFSLLSPIKKNLLTQDNKRPSIRERGSLRSKSLVRWTQNLPMKAECLFAYTTHEPPSLDCSCGLYGVKESKWGSSPYWRHSNTILARITRGKLGTIAGKVELWGRYVEHENVWRAEYAYPAVLSACKCERCGEIISFSMAKALVHPGVELGPLTIVCRDCLIKPLYNGEWIPMSYVLEQIEFLYGLEVN